MHAHTLAIVVTFFCIGHGRRTKSSVELQSSQTAGSLINPTAQGIARSTPPLKALAILAAAYPSDLNRSQLSSPDGLTVPAFVWPAPPHRNSAVLRGASTHDIHRDIPDLRFLGDAQLMHVQPELRVAERGSDACREMVATLRDAMAHYGGIGIAAPQIGLWSRIFVFGIDGTNPRYPAAEAIPFQVWINPEISWSSAQTNWMWEGCLSVPGLRGWVERPRAVRLCGYDENGTKREVELAGLAARIAQHELDHLDGILFPSRTPGTEFIVPQASMEAREGWGDGWPSRGSRRTGLGELSDEM